MRVITYQKGYQLFLRYGWTLEGKERESGGRRGRLVEVNYKLLWLCSEWIFIRVAMRDASSDKDR